VLRRTLKLGRFITRYTMTLWLLTKRLSLIMRSRPRSSIALILSMLTSRRLGISSSTIKRESDPGARILERLQIR
jgi:hypothetical protein